MKFAVFSDIHGNAYTLKMALDDAVRRGAERFIFAGDYCISAPWPRQVVEIMQSLPDSYIVRGNEESYLHQPESDDGQFEISRWCMHQLSDKQIAWLDDLPFRIDFECEGVQIHITHSSAEFINECERIFGKTSHLALHYGSDFTTFEENLRYVQNKLIADNEFKRMATDLPEGVYIFGHSHDQWYLEHNRRVFLNPGSVGIPLDCIKFSIPYTLLNVNDGVVEIEAVRVACDPEELICVAKQTTQYQEAQVWSEIIFSEWRTSREKVYFFLKFAEEYAASIGDYIRPFTKVTWEAAYKNWIEKKSGKA